MQAVNDLTGKGLLKPIIFLVFVFMCSQAHSQIPRSGDRESLRKQHTRAAEMEKQRRDAEAIARTQQATKKQLEALKPAPPPKNETEHLRLFNGQVYNVLRSTNWTTVPQGRNIGGRLVFVDVVNGKSLFEAQTSRGYNSFWNTDSFVFVTNMPGQSTFVTGQVLGAQRLFRIGLEEHAGRRLALYDYGIPVVTNAVTQK